VDDEDGIRDFLGLILRTADYIVSTAQDGEQGLQKIKGESPDLVLLDIMMPVLDGWGVLERLRAMPDPRPAVVVLSAAADPGRAIEMGAAAALSKPFRIDELLATCARVLAGR
jgi:DNA-binding response OmpR family regulator